MNINGAGGIAVGGNFATSNFNGNGAGNAYIGGGWTGSGNFGGNVYLGGTKTGNGNVNGGGQLFQESKFTSVPRQHPDCGRNHRNPGNTLTGYSASLDAPGR